MVGEVVSALMEIVNCPPLIIAPSQKLIGVLLVQVLAAAVLLVAVVTCVCDDARLKIRTMFFVDLRSSYYSLLCFARFSAN